MPMACSSSCKIFETFGTVVECVARHKLSIPYILHLLDDFLVVAPSESLRHSQLNIILDKLLLSWHPYSTGKHSRAFIDTF